MLSSFRIQPASESSSAGRISWGRRICGGGPRSPLSFEQCPPVKKKINERYGSVLVLCNCTPWYDNKIYSFVYLSFCLRSLSLGHIEIKARWLFSLESIITFYFPLIHAKKSAEVCFPISHWIIRVNRPTHSREWVGNWVVKQFCCNFRRECKRRRESVQLVIKKE